MASKTLRRIQLPQSPCAQQQIRHASLLRRPHRPYTFTQLTILSDGSSFTCRTTSPAPIYRSTKDSRNHPIWQPSLESLRNVEQDEAGRLRRFREKFGRGWDLGGGEEGEEVVDGKEERKGGDGGWGDEGESLMDLISGSGQGGYDEVVDEREVGSGEGRGEREQKMVTVKQNGVLVKVPSTKKK
jgi:ribosomal protein L31